MSQLIESSAPNPATAVEHIPCVYQEFAILLEVSGERQASSATVQALAAQAAPIVPRPVLSKAEDSAMRRALLSASRSARGESVLFEPLDMSGYARIASFSHVLCEKPHASDGVLGDSAPSFQTM